MDELVAALLKPEAWPFPVARVEHLETHISHLFLVGEFAYKVKKPVDLGFLDFSTLERRRFFCEEEVRLNSRTAPGIYLDAVPISRDGGALHVEGQGEPVEYAVKMRRFDQSGLLDRCPLNAQIIEALVQRVAAFHGAIPAAPAGSDWGEPEKVWFPVEQNFHQVRELGLFPQLDERLDGLEGEARQRFGELRELLAQRKKEGFIRECHGDLHLGNIAWVEGDVLVFDGIEFNPDLRWIDVANDIAFLLMDLEYRGQERLAWRFLNRYLELTGDYAAARLLPFYKAYRAMVRAKVAAIRLAQEGGESAALREEFTGYLEYAERCLAPGTRPTLCITHGLSGSGKSHFCLEMRERLGMIHLRSDLERKRLFGLAPDARSRSAVEGGIYTPEATQRTYGRLLGLAGELLDGGYSVVVDATFLEASRRAQFRALAEARGACFRILAFEAPESVLRERVVARSRKGGDPSEADLAVLERQLEKREPLTPEEGESVVRVDATQQPDWQGLKAQLACNS